MATFQPGDIVDITIKGVRVDEENADGTVTIVADHPDGKAAHWQMPPQAAIERVAPAHWPPQVGDLWKDRNGEAWFAVNVGDDWQDGPDGDWRLVSLAGNAVYPSVVVERYGPLTLVLRETKDGES